METRGTMACLKPGATSWPGSEASLEPVSVEARREWVGTGVNWGRPYASIQNEVACSLHSPPLSCRVISSNFTV